jgi:hypothetical protein
MTQPIAAYSFLPWLRQGLGITVSGTSGTRATVSVTVTARGEAVDGGPARAADTTRSVALYGPGDVIGIESRAIVRGEPRPWTTNAEPNYLAYLDFYDEDFPWRYTAAGPAGDRLTPWLTLAVLREEEFDDEGPGDPLPWITVHSPGAVLPPPDQLWAWAHVHVNGSLAGPTVSADGPAAAAALTGLLTGDRDRAYSRLLSPRRLEPDTAYHAFLVPTFEAGRLAGLGGDPDGATGATQIAWTAGLAQATPMPVYHRWYFRTGSVGDFEYLVRLLVPRRADPRVGRRPFDTRAPGSGLPPIEVDVLDGVLLLGGALKVPDTAVDAESEVAAQVAADGNWDGGIIGGHPFQTALAALLNLPDDYARADSPQPGGADPVLAPPLYGRWHALRPRLLVEPDGTPVPDPGDWMHRLNLDPRFRVPAALGAAVVQDRQEEYMAAAWAQIGQVLEANRAIRLARLARDVSASWYRRTVLRLTEQAPERVLALTAPVHGRIVAGGTTLAHRRRTSRLPESAVSGTMRRLLRPRGPLARRLPGTAAPLPEALAGLATGRLTTAPARPPLGAPTVERLVVGLREAGGDERLDLLIGWFKRLQSAPAGAGEEAARVVEGLPALPRFTPMPAEEIVRWETGDRDSQEAAAFKDALTQVYGMQAAAAEATEQAPRPALQVPGFVRDAVSGLDPAVTVPRQLAHTLTLPERIVDGLRPGPDGMVDEVMAYPVIDTPMYEHLVARSSELFLPNLNLVPNNSISLLETNQPFIEAYLVGLNHEFGRELLWREYPTDQRGSTFRQFWDIAAQLAATDGGPAAREALRDIPPLHTWRRGSPLGDHDARDPAGAAEEELVLVIRGELLKRYPNAVVYAHRADWARTAAGAIDRTRPRRLVDLPTGDPRRSDVRTPLYRARVEPDVHFLGFNLTEEVARGDTGPDAQDPGWFFVLKERPGEPRFGLDVDSDLPDTGLRLWTDLAWEHVLPEPDGTPQFLRIDRSFTLVPPPAGSPQELLDQHAEDRGVRWATDTNAADLAYVLYQTPVLVAVHAAELLRKRP